MDTFQSKSFMSSVVFILVALLVAVVPNFESIRPELIEFLTLLGMTLIIGHKAKDVGLAKYNAEKSA
jgi:hypothetical protein